MIVRVSMVEMQGECVLSRQKFSRFLTRKTMEVQRAESLGKTNVVRDQDQLESARRQQAKIHHIRTDQRLATCYI
ncbi:hypothetical protein CPB83DRAFT_859512, partial [Crepidotus variabilis]